jgi:hypothetical protein
VFALQRTLGNSKDVKQKHSINRQQLRHLVQPSNGKALSDSTNPTCGSWDACLLVRHPSIIIRQMSYTYKMRSVTRGCPLIKCPIDRSLTVAQLIKSKPEKAESPSSWRGSIAGGL